MADPAVVPEVILPPDPTSPEMRGYPRDTVKLVTSFGLEGSRRNNVLYIADGILIHSCGDIVHFLDLKTMTYTFRRSVEGNGIGCVAVHPKRTYFCVCEKGVSPTIYIYEYPSMNLYKTLADGTERCFTAANFNADGDQLSTHVGGSSPRLSADGVGLGERADDLTNQGIFTRSFQSRLFKIFQGSAINLRSGTRPVLENGLHFHWLEVRGCYCEIRNCSY